MALSILKGLLQGYVQSLFDEGIVNDQFSHIQSLKSAEKPDSVVQFISMYCDDVGAIISELKSYIDLPDVDFSRLAAEARKVEEKSLRIGAEHMRLACADLIQACEENNKENFSRALKWMKNEFVRTRSKLESFAQMERRIIRLESRPPHDKCVCSSKSSSSCG
ncbi:histidine-containing phosphotransfer protein 1-like [Malania oleifera]|uniref:histidine-containing phosphotransfer protein 1-like n=1 Tax=Malania oleifera TaxID=397392 RepID=UPI0025AE7D92|nr:histidine-containing phosphotransfer protein 1-like [Malania oleifera]XP_057954701.1 histidine-containing phosphotransfer protein 1-like [Malania oleifera]